ncbi:MAG: hypothetical protein PHN82_10190 [bacterium]|nr:hypothetical protein [bacterium]
MKAYFNVPLPRRWRDHTIRVAYNAGTMNLKEVYVITARTETRERQEACLTALALPPFPSIKRNMSQSIRQVQSIEIPFRVSTRLKKTA